LSAVGRLSPQVLGLRVPVYDANVHYQQVRDTWAGVRTPDGRFFPDLTLAAMTHGVFAFLRSAIHYDHL
jgi:hypothetical protein